MNYERHTALLSFLPKRGEILKPKINNMKLDQFEIEELAAHICGLDYDNVEYSDIEESLYEKFNIDFDSFQNLMYALVPMIDVGTSPLTGTRYKGFSKVEKNHGCWLLRVEVPSAVAVKKKVKPSAK